jgi:hypothetical protein
VETPIAPKLAEFEAYLAAKAASLPAAFAASDDTSNAAVA